MRVQLFNANGLVGKAEAVRRLALDQNVDVAITVETWLRKNTAIPLRPHVANITHDKPGTITGGRRADGGILVTATNPAYLHHIRLAGIGVHQYAVAMEVGDIVLIAAYLPPSLVDTALDELLAFAESIIGDRQTRCVITGDLNARSEALFGDHTSNTRGRHLDTLLHNSTFQPQVPVAGKWTSFNEHGYGIPDVVLANFEVQDLVVHEGESCGGSNHRPLTFTIPDTPTPPKSVNRWNI